MNRLCSRTTLVLMSAAALILGGCATMDAPGPQSGDDAPAYSASPSTLPPSGFGSPQGLFQRYPEMRDQSQ
jgi:hypothetical protein